MSDKIKQCAHPACNCVVDEDTKYCSPYCEDAGDTTEISCNCGHAGCAVGERQPTMTARG
jgi:hypothetical protein